MFSLNVCLLVSRKVFFFWWESDPVESPWPHHRLAYNYYCSIKRKTPLLLWPWATAFSTSFLAEVKEGFVYFSRVREREGENLAQSQSSIWTLAKRLTELKEYMTLLSTSIVFFLTPVHEHKLKSVFLCVLTILGYHGSQNLTHPFGQLMLRCVEHRKIGQSGAPFLFSVSKPYLHGLLEPTSLVRL